MNKRFAIFDMDGTLVDSMVFWRRLGYEYLESKGVTENLDDVMERIKTMTMTDSSKLFIEEFALEGTPESVADEMNGMMEEHYRKDIPLKVGVRTYLEKLYLAGVKMCVVSAADEALMRGCMTRLGVDCYFEFYLSCEEVGAGKNKPDVYFEAARRLGALPEEIAVYEDALYAARTAKEAGFYTVGVYENSCKDKWQSVQAISDESIHDWTQITEL